MAPSPCTPSGDSGVACGSFDYQGSGRPKPLPVEFRRIFWRHDHRFFGGGPSVFAEALGITFSLAPAFCASRIIGSTLAANRSASALTAFSALCGPDGALGCQGPPREPYTWMRPRTSTACRNCTAARPSTPGRAPKPRQRDPSRTFAERQAQGVLFRQLLLGGARTIGG